MQQTLSTELKDLESQIYLEAGEEFNINSPKQLAAVLFEKLLISTKGVKKTKSGFSTDATVLTKLKDLHPVVPYLLEYRELHKLKTTYVDSLQRLVHPQTGRIHTSFNQAIAATGRLSSSDPNMQNIPIRTSRGRALRHAFVAEESFVLISADYSQIELRVLAELSGDETLRSAFVDGEDIHARTAREIFGAVSFGPEEAKEFRRVAKTINFGIIYGMGAFRLANELGVSRKQAQAYIDDYFARYPRVQTYYDELRSLSQEHGYVETYFGRRRYVRDIDASGRDGGYLERSLLNAPLQGTAAEIIKLAMVKLYDRLSKYGALAKMVLQVHDELVFEVSEDLQSELAGVIVEEMENAAKFSVPLKVDVRVGRTWGGDSP
jgi:DNA polymerase-1